MQYDPLLAKFITSSGGEFDINDNHPFHENNIENNNTTDIKVFLHGKYKNEPLYINGDNEDNYLNVSVDSENIQREINTTLHNHNEQSYDSDPEDEEEMRARKYSIIHDEVKNGQVVFISFDIKTGGDDCGIVQLSSEYFILSSNGDEGGGRRLKQTFDSYVKPHESAIWSKYATEIHGLHKNHPSIITADPLELVWERFETYLNDIIPIGHKGVLVAWNGETCDMEW